MLRGRLHEPSWRSVLDAGCGHGLYLRELQAPGRFVVGVDAKLDNAAAASAACASASACGAVLQRLPFRDAVFDLVTSIEVLTHIQPRLQAAAVAELFRVLKPGGTLFLSVHNSTRHWAHLLKRRFAGRPSPTTGMSIYPFVPFRLKRLLRRAGFRVRRPVSYFNYFNGLGFDLARERPDLALRLAHQEDVVARIPLVRSLSITFFVEGIKPESPRG